MPGSVQSSLSFALPDRGTAERSPGSETAIEVLAQEGVAVRSTDQSAARRSQIVERSLQHCCSVAASREEDAKAARWAASKEGKGSGEGRGEGSQPAEDHHRQMQGSDSGSEAG